MRRERIYMVVSILLTIAVIVGCGIGTHKRLVFRPSTYQEMLIFPSTGDPLDVEQLVAEYPELKGIVITAPQYIEEYAKLLADAKAKGIPIVEFRIPAGMTLQIEVVGEPGYPKSFIVGPHGYIDMPLIRKVDVVGKTIDQIRDDMEKKLAKYIISPQVIINPLSAPSSFTAGGTEVGVAPGGISGGDIVLLGVVQSRWVSNVQYTGKETLIGVLGQSGLPPDAEWRQIRVIRRVGQTPEERLKKSRVIICDLWNYFALADVRQDIPLMPGDVVFVPPKLSLGEQFRHDFDEITHYLSGIMTMSQFNDSIIKRVLNRGQWK